MKKKSSKKKSRTNFTAIDLYSGVGGWSLGFQIAGIKVTDSYEWWEPANNTHKSNLHSNTHQIDIRELDVTDLPSKVDFLVGSPPCTEFSYSNRGGSGNIKDGLKDVTKFLHTVKYLNPKFWAMENVPRLANIFRNEILPGGQLEEFSDILDPKMIHVYDFSKFGLPQRRKRCIAGNFDNELLESYIVKFKELSLGKVITALSKKRIKDPNFKIYLSKNNVSEQEKEEILNWEELRYNKEAKTNHPIYNNMAFPDPMEKTVRTITATCTRVSRESIVISDSNDYRRLTIRERACLQGFPISYQFMGKSYAAKLKMIGNAIPPIFTYYLANAMLGTKVDNLLKVGEVDYDFPLPEVQTEITKPDSAGKKYPRDRSFRFAIPHLRFKSGTRFELNNQKGKGRWLIEFFFGDSKRIHSLELGSKNYNAVSKLMKKWAPDFQKEMQSILKSRLLKVDCAELQKVWSNTSCGIHPFEVLDSLGDLGLNLIELSKNLDHKVFSKIVTNIMALHFSNSRNYISKAKLEKYAREIVIGIMLGSAFNKHNYRL